MQSLASAPAWLFSFVDLAFLLLIAMTQLGDDGRSPDLGEISIPRVEMGEGAEAPIAARERWQLRIHAPVGAAERPYELARGGSAGEPSDRLSAPELRGRLGALQSAHREAPLLAPHADSRSQDLLEAVAAVEELWPGRRRAAVIPVLGRR